MIYEYESEDGDIIEIQKSMTEEIPKEIKENGILYKRKYSLGSGGIHIPLDFGSSENSIKFDKSPSRRKHFY